MDNFPINQNILNALKMLEDNGYQAYIVGGAVRDLLLDLEVNDYDIVTNAKLDEAIEVFKDYECKKYISKGLTIGVKFNHTYFELSCFKGNTIEEDLFYRDFSINSMAYNPSIGLIDPYHGLSDLVSFKLRTIRDIKDVFFDDPLRILRAIRFMVLRKMKPVDELKEAINQYSYLLNDIKKERVAKELDPILLSEKPSIYIREYKMVFFQLFPALKDCYLFDQKCPKWHNLDVFSHILKVIDSVKCDLVLRMASLFHDIKKPEVFTIDSKGVGHFYGHAIKSMEYAEKVLKEYAYNHNFIHRVCHLIYYHDYPLEEDENKILKFLYKFGTKDLDLFFGLKRGDILGQNPNLYSRLYEIDNISNLVKKIINEEKIITYSNLRINGDILKELGYQGEEIGKALEIILKKVIKKELKNDSLKLYEYAAKLRFHLNEYESQ